MKVGAAIIAPKRLTGAGDWKLITGVSKMPKNAFPLGSNYPVTMKRNWHWRVDRLAGTSGTSFRLLTAYDARVEEYRAWLAMDFERSSVLLARYEFHGTHPGWHCHAPCDEISAGDLGALRTRGCNRFPGPGRFHRGKEFDTTSEERALARSFTFYRVAADEGGLL